MHNGSVMPALQRAYNIAQAESSGRVLQTGLPRLAELQQIISRNAKLFLRPCLSHQEHKGQGYFLHDRPLRSK